MAPLVVLAPLIAWLIASRTLVAYFATTAPETALLLNPSDPTALIALADQAIEFDKEPTTKSLGEARLRSGRRARACAARCSRTATVGSAVGT